MPLLSNTERPSLEPRVLPPIPSPQVSYRINRVVDEDNLRGSFPGTAEYDVAQVQAPTAVTTRGPDVPGLLAVSPDATRGLWGEDEIECVVGIGKVLLKYIWKKIKKNIGIRRLDEGEFSVPTQVMTYITITDPVDGNTVYALIADVGTNGEAIVLWDATSLQVNDAGTGLCDGCDLYVEAGECLSGDCDNFSYSYDLEVTDEYVEIIPTVSPPTVPAFSPTAALDRYSCWILIGQSSLCVYATIFYLLHGPSLLTDCFATTQVCGDPHTIGMIGQKTGVPVEDAHGAV